MPATAGGSTRGSSITVSTTAFPGKLRVASAYAAGVPTSAMTAVAIAVVSRLSRRASVDCEFPRLDTSRPHPVLTKIASTGRNRNDRVIALANARSSANHSGRARATVELGRRQEAVGKQITVPCSTEQPRDELLRLSGVG